MKEFLKSTLIETFEDGFLGFVFGIFSWLILLSTSLLTLFYITYLVDSSFLQDKKGVATVQLKYVIPAHFETTYVMVGKVMTPIQNFHEEKCMLVLSVSGIEDEVNNCYYYSSFNVGDSIEVTYSNGRLFNSLYIK